MPQLELSQNSCDLDQKDVSLPVSDQSRISHLAISENQEIKRLRKIFWVSSSHWDREWYKPFEEFRCALIDMVDRAIECVEKVPGYDYFFLDGQSVILTDYLEFQPENEARIRRLLESERMFAGPFYVLQDEMVVDGELLVRNLQKGLSLAKAYGTRRFVGYTPDAFGHCAQLPQVLRLAGVDSVVFSRAFQGVSQLNRWVGPDGSDVLFVWLPKGYGGGTHQDCLNGGRHLPEDYEKALQLFTTNTSQLSRYSVGGNLMIVDGGDHLFPDPAAVDLAASFNSAYQGEPEFCISSMPDAVEALSREENLPHVFGEMRWYGKDGNGWILPGTYSSRMPLKYGLSTATRELIALEKLGVIRGSRPGPAAAMEKAWTYLLENTPHDSICGCHIDTVYLENAARINSAKAIISYHRNSILSAFEKDSGRTGDVGKAIFYDAFPQRDLWKPFEVEVPFEIIDTPEHVCLESSYADFIILGVEPYEIHHSHLTTYRVKGVYRNHSGSAIFAAHFGVGRKRSLQTSDETSFSHGHFTVDLLSDGTITLTDRSRNLVFGPMLLFIDGGDAGDTYNYSPPVVERIYLSSGSPAEVAVTELGSGLLCLTSKVCLEIPKSLTTDRLTRSTTLGQLEIQSRVVIDLNTGVIWVDGYVKNGALDHRLRIAFGTPHTQDHSWSGAPYAIERRPVELAIDTDDYSEKPLTDYPVIDFVSYGGLTVYTAASGEYQITDHGIEMTILRAVGDLGRPDVPYRKGQAGPFFQTPLAQLEQQEIPFSFIVKPSGSSPAEDYLQRDLLIPTRSNCIRSTNTSLFAHPFPLTVDRIYLSVMREMTDGCFEVRLFNPHVEAVETFLKSTRPIEECTQVDLCGDPVVGGESLGGTHPRVIVRPFQILTFRIKFSA